jgi:hypothetical protein
LSTSGQLLSTSSQLLSTSGQLLSTKKKSIVLECKYCNEIFNIRQSRWKHEQKCKIKDNDNKKIEIDKLKYEIELLKSNQPLKRRHGPLGRNNQIITTNNNNTNNNTKNSNNNSNNNNINNTINIVKFGTERLSEILNENEMLKITEFINNSVNESIKRVHLQKNRIAILFFVNQELLKKSEDFFKSCSF